MTQPRAGAKRAAIGGYTGVTRRRLAPGLRACERRSQLRRQSSGILRRDDNRRDDNRRDAAGAARIGRGQRLEQVRVLRLAAHTDEQAREQRSREHGGA